MNVSVSVIVPCFRAGAFISKSLNSVGDQSFTDWELLVVDDAGPEDGTADVVRRFAAAHPSHRVEWIRHPKNRGVSAARNTAIAESRGSHVALLDPDDYWSTTHLETAMEVFKRDPDISLCSSQAFLFQGSSTVPFGVERYEDWELSAFPYILGMRNAIPASSVVMSKDVLDRIGFFDETPAIQHCEDYDLWLRLVEAGHKIFLVGEPTVYYRKHQGGATSNPTRLSTARLAVIEKHQKLLFVLQREALEHLCGALKHLYASGQRSLDLADKQERRLATIELTISKIKALQPIAKFIQFRQWLLSLTTPS